MNSCKIEGDAEAALSYIASRRAPIAANLEALAARRGGELAIAPGGAGECMARIAEFCIRGKMIRGGLVYLGAEVAAAGPATGPVPQITESSPDPRKANESLSRIAAAMELFQAGLLVHDDIMDRDEIRRGAATIHARYAAEAKACNSAETASRSAADSLHIGEALGMCLGDLCYFEAFTELARALECNQRSGEILGFCASILSEVAVAQMADVRWGGSSADVPEEDILAMYRCKTARYSFSLPLAVGALYAGATALSPPLMNLGERLGILFQIRDDELGIFGDEANTGKGQGSDLREGKKTFFRARLLAAAPNGERIRLDRLFGGGATVRSEDIAYIRLLADELGVARSITEISHAAEREARMIIDRLPGLRTETARILKGLVEYVTRREK